MALVCYCMPIYDDHYKQVLFDITTKEQVVQEQYV